MPNQRHRTKRSVNAWLPVDLANELTKEASRRNCSRSDIVREILEEALAKRAKKESCQSDSSDSTATPLYTDSELFDP
jgi:metal-responsive CopG/Arc/MetJ family transcriptional regulator